MLKKKKRLIFIFFKMWFYKHQKWKHSLLLEMQLFILKANKCRLFNGAGSLHLTDTRDHAPVWGSPVLVGLPRLGLEQTLFLP